ncbi:LOW QUALITY PROTEIN: serine/threonine-protein phosphatase 7 long form [Cinnamomum micranthum f. kanehirae]|uniref:Serine/threonine-protein phosphatase 7 long form n=1 Tax=Cinnamomum micranthum f. kanehirae TaxID=337451 RepID=A0A443P6F7_9MAGN|nr:LOW QUALITY PROTEIN: serine/threonine-protein phosphatase 7 long form [Cinnamomum micranthum f. kanehirae]
MSDRGALKCLSHGQKVPYWQLNEFDRFKALVSRFRLAPLVTTSYRSINKIIVSGFVESWQPETNTFHMPFGEMTITLDDVASILGIPVMGRTVSFNERMTYEEAQALLVDALEVESTEAHEEHMKSWCKYGANLLDWSGYGKGFVSDDDGDEMVDCAIRAYLLYLFGCTLFTYKSGTRVPIIFLTVMVDLEVVHSYAWGTAALSYLYRQLGLATRHEVKQIAGYLTLLEAWVCEHFECLTPTPNIYYQSDQPRVHRWVPRSESVLLQGLRGKLDSMSTDLLTWDPYRDVRQYHPFNEVAYYCG